MSRGTRTPVFLFENASTPRRSDRTSLSARRSKVFKKLQDAGVTDEHRRHPRPGPAASATPRCSGDLTQPPSQRHAGGAASRHGSISYAELHSLPPGAFVPQAARAPSRESRAVDRHCRHLRHSLGGRVLPPPAHSVALPGLPPLLPPRRKRAGVRAIATRTVGMTACVFWPAALLDLLLHHIQSYPVARMLR